MGTNNESLNYIAEQEAEEIDRRLNDDDCLTSAWNCAVDAVLNNDPNYERLCDLLRAEDDAALGAFIRYFTMKEIKADAAQEVQFGNRYQDLIPAPTKSGFKPVPEYGDSHEG